MDFEDGSPSQYIAEKVFPLPGYHGPVATGGGEGTRKSGYVHSCVRDALISEFGQKTVAIGGGGSHQIQFNAGQMTRITPAAAKLACTT